MSVESSRVVNDPVRVESAMLTLSMKEDDINPVEFSCPQSMRDKDINGRVIEPGVGVARPETSHSECDSQGTERTIGTGYARIHEL